MPAVSGLVAMRHATWSICGSRPRPIEVFLARTASCKGSRRDPVSGLSSHLGVFHSRVTAGVGRIDIADD